MTRQRHCPPEMCSYVEETDTETQRQSPGVLGRRGAEALSCPPGEGRGPRQPLTLPPPQQRRSYLASFSHSEAAPQEKHDPPGHFLLGHLPIQQWGWIEWSFPFWEETIKAYTYIGNSSGGPAVRTLHFHCWGPWVQSLIGKLRFHKPHGTAKKKSYTTQSSISKQKR